MIPGAARCSRRRWPTWLALVAFLASFGLPCRAEEPPPPAVTAPAATPTPAVIPVAEIALSAEETDRTVRSLREGLEPPASVKKIESALPELTERAERLARETRTGLRGSPSPNLLEHLSVEWARLRDALSEWALVLQKRVVSLEKDHDTLDRLEKQWRASQAEARAAGAPPAVLERVERTLGQAQGLRAEVRGQRTRILVLQDSVTSTRGRCDESIERISRARRASLGQLFTPDTPPIWSTKNPLYRSGEQLPAAWTSLTTELSILVAYLRAHPRAIAVHLILVLSCLILLVRARRHLLQSSGADEDLVEATVIFQLPLSSTIVVAVLAMIWLYPPPAPRILRVLAGTVAVWPTIRIVSRLIAPALAPALYLLSVFFVLDRVRDLVAVAPRIEQALVLIQLAAAIVLLGSLLRTRLTAARAAEAKGAPLRVVRAFGRLLLGVFTFSFLAGVLGYMGLARFLGTGLLEASYLALGLYAAFRVAEGIVAYLLHTDFFSSLRMVRRHRARLERRIRTVVGWVATAVWIVGLLLLRNLWEPVREGIEAVLTASLGFGDLAVSLGDFIAFGLTVWFAFALSAFVRFTLAEDVYPRLQLARGVPYAISNLLHYSILLTGFFLACAAMGFDLGRFTLLAGAFGVGIGFGLQNIVNNFVSGLILLFERPVQVGDTVQLPDLLGEVRRIGIRSSTIRSMEGAEVIVPNASLISDPVTNWTLSDRLRRIDLQIGVAYGSDPAEVQKILEGVANGHPLTLSEPPPVALFIAFGDSSLDFQVRAWTANFENWVVTRSELNLAVHAALKQAGITIPFPQRDVHFAPVGALDVRMVRAEKPQPGDEIAAEPKPPVGQRDEADER